MINPLDATAALGRGTIGLVRRTGAVALFGATGLSHLVRPPFYGRMFLSSFIEFAFFSLPVVALTALFSGMVIALQSYSGFARFNAQSAVASVVVISLVRELGPVLAALMVAGRIGASFAAVIGTTGCGSIYDLDTLRAAYTAARNPDERRAIEAAARAQLHRDGVPA